MSDDMKNKPDSYWREKLTEDQYKVMRMHGTEPPRPGKHEKAPGDGVYKCVACGQELFDAGTQFESTLPGLQGWPAFWAEAAKGRVELVEDNSFGMHRTEIVCARCGGHLGHLFEGDPAVADKGGQHYCVNACTLKFEAKK